MPRKSYRRTTKKRSARSRKFGGSMMGFLGNAWDFTKKHKLISTLGKAYSTTPYAYSSEVGKIAEFAQKIGLGRRGRGGRKRMNYMGYGGALAPAGNGRGGRYTYGRR